MRLKTHAAAISWKKAKGQRGKRNLLHQCYFHLCYNINESKWSEISSRNAAKDRKGFNHDRLWIQNLVFHFCDGRIAISVYTRGNFS